MKRSLITVLVVGLAFLGACGDDGDSESTGATGAGDCGEPKATVTIGAQGFGESEILAEVYAQGLEARCYDASVKKLGAQAFRQTEVEAFDKKEINFAPEYAASLLEFLNNKKGEASGDSTATYEKLDTYLAPKGLAALRPSAAVDTNAFVITKATSDKLGIKSLSDLAAKGKDLKIGAPADCGTNPFCLPGLKNTYGLDLSKNFTPLGAGQVEPALDADTVQIGLLFSTSGTIATKNYVLLEDDKKMLAADNVLPIVTIELRDLDGFAADVNEITEALTTDALIDMNKRFDIDKEDAAVIAKDFLTDLDLI